MAHEERRHISSLFSSRRKSSSRPTPTLVISDEMQNESAPDGRSLQGPNNKTMLESPTQSRPDTRHSRQGQTDPGKEVTTQNRWKKIRKAIFSKRTRKILCGTVLAICITISWVGATQFIKMTYYGTDVAHLPNKTNDIFRTLHQGGKYDASFFTTWYCTAWSTLFFPVYALLQCLSCNRKGQPTADRVLDAIRYYRDRGYSLGQFMGRTLLFCLLWVATNYLLIRSLRGLACTDVIALYSTNVAFVYLLSWVILHEQFVGVRIVAVILCNTGIALLAYMDGVAKTPTLGSVVMAASGSACSAVYKVLFRKSMGDGSLGSVCLFMTLISALSSLLLWPVFVGLSLAGLETLAWAELPWIELSAAAALTLMCNLLSNFGGLVTYEVFIALGLIMAVPLSSAVDITWFGAQFREMRLAGIILIVCGFFLVLFPSNWATYIATIVRWGGTFRHHGGSKQETVPGPVDYRTGVISRSRLRSTSGHVR